MKVLIVSSSHRLMTSLVVYFAAAGYEVLTATNTVAALGMIMGEEPDLVILELDERGPDACWQIRSVSQVPLIALCAGSETERIMALYRGADICLAMPVDYESLLAHSRALLLREHREWLPLSVQMKDPWLATG
ncbi:MAG: response regulator transcription factor [Anaerolineae bacterium]